MSLHTAPRRIFLALLACAALLLGAAGCGGDDGGSSGGGDPRTVLAAAKKHFDEAGSVRFTMSTNSVPAKGDAILGANGTLTHQPAFKGDVKVLYQGFNTSVPVVAVGGKVYAKLPLNPSYSTIDPAEFGAPDPAAFADPSSGISGLLGQIGGLKEDGQQRDGKKILTSYRGGLPGGVVSRIIPSATPDSDFKVVAGIDEDDRLTTLKVTGDFFDGSGDVTYTISFQYDENLTIKKP